MKSQEKNKNTLGASQQYWRAGKSINAQRAESEGRFSKTNFKKEYGFDPSNIITPSEWHHTSKFFNKTDYYDIGDVFEALWNMPIAARNVFLKNKKLKELWEEHKIDNAKNKLKENLEKGNYQHDIYAKEKNKNKDKRKKYLREKYFKNVDNNTDYFVSIYNHAKDLAIEFFKAEKKDYSYAYYKMLDYKEPVYELTRKIFDYMQKEGDKHSKGEARKYFNEHHELITDILNKPLGGITMITKQNYYSEIEQIGINKLPKPIQEMHESINELTTAMGKGLENFTDAEIKEYFIDKQFEALEKVLDKNSPKEKEPEEKFKAGTTVYIVGNDSYAQQIKENYGVTGKVDRILISTSAKIIPGQSTQKARVEYMHVIKFPNEKTSIVDLKYLTDTKPEEIIELTYLRVDQDTGNIIYRGTDNNNYVDVEGTIHDITDAGEPNTPVHNVKVKAGEPVYDKNDRFARRLSQKEVAKTDMVKTTKPKTSKPKTEKQEIVDHATYVEMIKPELRFIQRFVLLHGKVKTQEQILSFINALQKAIVTKVIRKTSPYAKEIEYIQESLITVCNKMGSSIKITLDAARYQTLKDFADSEKVMLSIIYIKQYISLHGKTGINEKAESLLKRITKAVESGKIPEDCPYMDEIKDIQINLKEVVSGKATRLTVEKATLNSLNGFCKCPQKSLSGRMPKNNQKNYKFYVVFDKKYILGGNEFKEDANDLMKEIIENYPNLKSKLAVFNRSFLNVIKLNPDENNNWRNYSNLQGLGFFSDMITNIAANVIYDIAANVIYDIPAIKAKINNATNKVVERVRSVASPVTLPVATAATVNTSGKVNSMQIKDMNFKKLGLKGKYAKVIGDPAEPFSMMIYGAPGSGKSTIAIDIAKNFASDYNKKVAYVAKEEGVGATIQDKFQRLNAFDRNIDIYSNKLPDTIEAYNYIFIDSINEMGLTYEQLSAMQEKAKSKGVCFVYLFKATKNGSYRGSQEFEHLVDVSISVTDGIARTEKSRFGGNGAVKIYNKENQMIPKFTELTKAEQYRVKQGKPLMLTQGDDGKYWVVTPEHAELLIEQGFDVF